MNENLRRKCELLGENYQLSKKVGALEYAAIEALVALLYTSAGKTADVPAVKECKPLLKKRAGFFSSARGIMKNVLLTKASMAENPAEYIDLVVSTTEQLQRYGVFSSEYLLLAGMTIVDNVEPDRIDDVVEGTKATLKKMNDEHPFLTNSSDSSFAALLYIYGTDIDAVLQEAETCYQIISPRFKVTKDSAQAAAQLLALGQKPAEEKCKRFLQLFDALKDAGHNMHKGRQVAILAAFADFDGEINEIARQIAEADSMLKTIKGFHGIMGIQPDMRRLMAAALALEAKSEDEARVVAPAAAAGAALSEAVAEDIILTMIMIMVIIIISTSSNTN